MHAAALAMVTLALAGSETFDERVRVAKLAEVDSAFAAYQSALLEPVGADMTRAMTECVQSTTGASTEDFTLVAELADDGRPVEIAVRPETNVATCWAARFAALRFAPPPRYPGRSGFPLVFEMRFHLEAPPTTR
jgi:hypothetical protein